MAYCREQISRQPRGRGFGRWAKRQRNKWIRRQQGKPDLRRFCGYLT